MIKKIIILLFTLTISHSYAQQSVLLIALSGSPQIKIGTTESYICIRHPEDAKQGNIEPKEIKNIKPELTREDPNLKAKKGKTNAEVLVTAEKGAKSNILDVSGFFKNPKKFYNMEGFWASIGIIPIN